MGDFVETGRGGVEAWECDAMGHMNVRHYVARAEAGLIRLGQVIGVDPGSRRARSVGLVPRETHIRFLAEQRAGAPVLMLTGVVSVSDTRLTVYQELRSVEDGTISATFLSEVELVDLNQRRPLPLPEGVAAAVDPLVVDVPAHGRPRGLAMDPPRPTPTLAEAEQLGMFPVYRGPVSATSVDGWGRMTGPGFIGCISDGMSVAITLARGSVREPGLGGAALEYRLAFRAAPQESDLLVLMSGLRGYGGKAVTWVHWLFDEVTGACVMTAENVGIAMDLNARRAIDIPPSMRERYARITIPGLTL